MRFDFHLPKLGRTTVRWIMEATLIIVSVAIGFAVSELREYRADQSLATQVLRGVHEEVTYNLSLLEPAIAKHRQWAQTLAAVDVSRNTKSAFEVLFESRPGDANIGVPLRQAAWDTAVSTGALRLIDYEIAAALSDIYGYQDLMSVNLSRLVQGVVYTPATFDASNQAASVQVMRWLMTEVEGNERYLLDLYKRHLPLLQAAASE